MMEKWEKEWDDVLVYENSGNDYFYEWWNLKEYSMNSLFEDWVEDAWADTPVKIKINKKAIMIIKK